MAGLLWLDRKLFCDPSDAENGNQSREGKFLLRKEISNVFKRKENENWPNDLFKADINKTYLENFRNSKTRIPLHPSQKPNKFPGLHDIFPLLKNNLQLESTTRDNSPKQLISAPEQSTPDQVYLRPVTRSRSKQIQRVAVSRNEGEMSRIS
ncbi:unnamed protein product [Larinioides sclopetarius]|uniref:Uncharacterized protein n=1 Tax=Larinioides sclopetarius TaxID=280406 RepID=A0AAV2AZE5_9ARAC